MRAKRSGITKRVKRELTAAFSIVDMEPISFYLDLKVERDCEQKLIKLSQLAYIDKVLQKFYLNQANSTNMPIKEGIILLPNNSAQASRNKQEKFQGMTGSIMFSMVKTQPDMAFATSVISRFVKNPSHQHIEAVKTILKYLKGSRDWGIMYEGEKELCIKGYSDSD